MWVLFGDTEESMGDDLYFNEHKQYSFLERRSIFNTFHCCLYLAHQNQKSFKKETSVPLTLGLADESQLIKLLEGNLTKAAVLYMLTHQCRWDLLLMHRFLLYSFS